MRALILLLLCCPCLLFSSQKHESELIMSFWGYRLHERTDSWYKVYLCRACNKYAFYEDRNDRFVEYDEFIKMICSPEQTISGIESFINSMIIMEAVYGECEYSKK